MSTSFLSVTRGRRVVGLGGGIGMDWSAAGAAGLALAWRTGGLVEGGTGTCCCGAGGAARLVGRRGGAGLSRAGGGLDCVAARLGGRGAACGRPRVEGGGGGGGGGGEA
jgi:hypothetical protein